MTTTAKRAIQNELDGSERVLWSGRPVPRHALWSGFPGETWLARAWFLLLALLAAQPFSLAGVYLIVSGVDGFVPPQGAWQAVGFLLMLLLALGLALGPYIMILLPRFRAYRNARDVHYVITNRRALILLIRDGAVVDRHAAYLQSLPAPRLKMVGRSGVGDVIYASGGAFHAEGASGYTSHYDVGFEGVPNARHVLKRLEEAIQGSSRRGAKARG